MPNIGWLHQTPFAATCTNERKDFKRPTRQERTPKFIKLTEINSLSYYHRQDFFVNAQASQVYDLGHVSLYPTHWRWYYGCAIIYQYISILKVLELKLTHTVSHPALWHRIDLASSSLALSLHKHRDRSLISLHFRLRPICVGLDSKKIAVDWSVAGMDDELVGIQEPLGCCIGMASSLDDACIMHSKEMSACRSSL